MRSALLSVCLLSLCAASFAQSPDAVKYAPRPILLLDASPGVEAVMPMVFTENGQQHLEFIPSSKIKESMDRGGKPIRLGDVLAALNEATQRINQLQAENDRLWKIAMKDAPKSETVIVQQPTPPSAPSQAEIAAQQQAQANARRQQALQMWMLLQNGNRPQTLNLNVTDCTRSPALCAGR